MDEKKIQELNELILAYKRIAESSDGRKIMDDLWICCSVDVPVFNEADPNLETCIFRDGQRSVFLHIQSRINCKPLDPRNFEEDKSNENV